MNNFIVSSNGRILKGYKTKGGAYRAITRKWSKRYPDAVVHDNYTFYNHIDTLVEVRNLMNNKPVMIHKSEVGGPCDPSTELYWSM